MTVVDEAAFVTEDIDRALSPTRATGTANVVLLSTANGQSGFFFEQRVEESSSWTRTQIDAEDCPRFNGEFLAEMRLALGEDGFNQEFHNHFLSAPGASLNRDMVANAFRSYIKPLFPWNRSWSILPRQGTPAIVI